MDNPNRHPMKMTTALAAYDTETTCPNISVQLPVDSYYNEFLQLLATNQCIIIAGEVRSIVYIIVFVFHFHFNKTFSFLFNLRRVLVKPQKYHNGAMNTCIQ